MLCICHSTLWHDIMDCNTGHYIKEEESEIWIWIYCRMLRISWLKWVSMKTYQSQWINAKKSHEGHIQKAELDSYEGGEKIDGWNIINLKYVNDTKLLAEGQSVKAGLPLNIKRKKILEKNYITLMLSVKKLKWLHILYISLQNTSKLRVQQPRNQKVKIHKCS